MSALLAEIAEALSGHLHPGAGRGAYERMHYTIDLDAGGTGASCAAGGLVAAMREGLATAAGLIRRKASRALRIRLELARPEDGAFSAEPVAAELRSFLRGRGLDRSLWDVGLSTTRLTVILRREAASVETVIEVLRASARAADGARSKPPGGEGGGGTEG